MMTILGDSTAKNLLEEPLIDDVGGLLYNFRHLGGG